ncbi:PREDICTED: uncharacterized protein LOC105566170 [Vollenhovia emeryi]|uniref:uncharacterized protein LOC105566170 n=1 Tax=Vollenhovia emeryi TaxID=411798 RepID=UPI0005F54CE3|nr:PREDICTED: uncharacterized protein LOC105566170 [Vollenhovia emeryi]
MLSCKLQRNEMPVWLARVLCASKAMSEEPLVRSLLNGRGREIGATEFTENFVASYRKIKICATIITTDIPRRYVAVLTLKFRVFTIGHSETKLSALQRRSLLYRRCVVAEER